MSKLDNTKAIPMSDINAEPPPKETTQEPTNIAPPKADKVAQQVVVKVTELGSFDFKNHIELNQAASIAMQLNLVPEKISKEGVKAAAAALMMCKQFNLPMKAMNEMGWIEGSLTVYGSLYWALLERHPEYGEHEMFWLDEAQERICSANKNLHKPVWAAVIRCKKKGSTITNEYFFTMDEAKEAKLYPPTKRDGSANTFSPWHKYFKDMLMHKVKKRMGDANYAGSLNGATYHEDMFEALTERNVTPDGEPAADDDLVAAFKKETQQPA